MASTSIEIINTGIVQARTDGNWWNFLEQRENWLEPFNCFLKISFPLVEGKQYCTTKFQSYDQACLCKVKIEVRKLNDETREPDVQTFELLSIGNMKEESRRINVKPLYGVHDRFYDYRIEIALKPFMMDKGPMDEFKSLKISNTPIAIPNIEKPAGLKLNGTMCDYEIVCPNKKFSCHKAVLATNVNHFEVL